MNELFSVKDQVVVITGGTGVLGRCIAEYLATEGAKVVILGRRKEEGDEIVAEIAAKGGEAMFLVTDVMNAEVLQANCDEIMAKYGRVDALLNAAGGNMPGATIAPTGNFFDVEIEAFKTVLNLNLTGTVLPTQIFLRPMVEAGKGSIVNFSSMAAFRPMTRVLGYAAAKAGISNFTAFLANEVATKFTPSIRVNAIAPGFFLTNQNRALLTNPDGSLTQRGADVIRQTPFKRFGKPEELCGTIQYLISDAASFVTGTVAVVDGGFNAFAM
ncbi:SDR family oxidoreductase [Duncaniella muris]|jgi:NAD(P)-dependent dehydrogenase (short-subunit alcohol dehydrogenase family)|uniref:KR domain-containing protein n=2 Tax=Duncaniella muris TaxID=2094150 RepID=A0A2V1IMZ1_9BACT|nr:SDR family oxidoreductase [Duncaniella muris]NBH91992.1 SDR family oxidoreductase [Muribaculaceae bacterium S4]NBI19962.1 SDR family oxidoreductase [Muribaculaceae bacterium Z1]ROS90801.1 SDR family oxidoreductase [Muribaculaceae bacterium Isolate-039 (Harlan)]ROS95701.1 SDR family oxidoreductase [Muribaculaceae bacterium Isolate-083 (Janvier)]ROS98744.1 SDR family oxidoreductase [Muribaculaceae bacterium Isolate-077 (Janvier)]ROT01671.1 SDR family oxidoreductase [Muribaculaceae bacterium 